MRGWHAWARPHGRIVVRPCVFSLSVLYRHGNFCRAQRTPTAKCPRTAFSSLLATRYLSHSWFISTSGNARHNCRAGAPERANHALPSTLFSLLSLKKDIPGPFVSIRGSIIPPFVPFVLFVVQPHSMDAWQNCRAGAPTRAIHALPSSPSSLFP